MMLFALYCMTMSYFAASAADAPTLRVCSYNIRYDNPSDGANRWSLRREKLLGFLRFEAVELLCAQEVLHSQLSDLLALPNMVALGVGRDDGKQAGEYSPILYDSTRLQALQSNTFWLSPNSAVPNRAWDAALPRICTWALFGDKQTRREFLVLNTHFDHIGQEARLNSALQLLTFIAGFQQAVPNLPVLLCGDLNATPEESPIQALNQVLLDSRVKTLTPPYGPEGTFTGFSNDSPEGKRIDYIFSNQHIKILRYGVFSERWGDNQLSDHRPVLVNCSF